MHVCIEMQVMLDTAGKAGNLDVAAMSRGASPKATAWKVERLPCSRATLDGPPGVIKHRMKARSMKTEGGHRIATCGTKAGRQGVLERRLGVGGRLPCTGRFGPP